MNENGLNGRFIVGGWRATLDSEEDEVVYYLDRSDLAEINLDFQKGRLNFIKKHPEYPDEYEIVQASDGHFYAIRYGDEKDYYSGRN